jgi:hypothetical protein
MPILHSVYFYFKDTTDPTLIEAQTHAILSELTQIEGVSNVMAGAPEGIDRDVVDNAYGTSLHLVVADRPALQKYQEDPIHQAYVARFKPNWSYIKVFDTRI